jgi:hypothetical protein
MATQNKNNSGVLFKNTKKNKENSPDYTGNVTVAGVDYHLAAWIQESKKSNMKYFSFAFTPWSELNKKAEKEKPPTKPAEIESDSEPDEVPF